MWCFRQQRKIQSWFNHRHKIKRIPSYPLIWANFLLICMRSKSKVNRIKVCKLWVMYRIFEYKQNIQHKRSIWQELGIVCFEDRFPRDWSSKSRSFWLALQVIQCNYRNLMRETSRSSTKSVVIFKSSPHDYDVNNDDGYGMEFKLFLPQDSMCVKKTFARNIRTYRITYETRWVAYVIWLI